MNQHEIEEEVRSGSRSDEGSIAGIFTSKLVGGLFALAFGAWAVVLGTVKNDVLEGQAQIQRDIAQVKADVSAHALFSAQKTAQFEAHNHEMERRVGTLESRHRNGTKHTIASDEE